MPAVLSACNNDERACFTQGMLFLSPIRWYDFNDSRVTPLSIFGIEKQFEGKENAYMLFYRRIAADTLSAKNTTEIETALANHDAAAPEGVSARDILLGKAAAPTGKPPPPALLPLPSFWQRYVDARNKSFTLRRDLYDRLANQVRHCVKPVSCICPVVSKILAMVLISCFVLFKYADQRARLSP